MSEVDAIISLLDKIGQLSGIGLAGLILYLFYKKIVVWGWQLTQCEAKKDTYELLIQGYNTKTEVRLTDAEAKLAEYERGKAA